MSVLILEDILAIVMMVMLSAIASGSSPDGGQMLASIVKIGFFLGVWFIVGIFAIPWFLRSVRKLINAETAHRFAGAVLRHGGTEYQGGVQQRLRSLRHGQHTGRNH